MGVLKDFYEKKIVGLYKLAEECNVEVLVTADSALTKLRLYKLAEECNVEVVGDCLLQIGEDIIFAIEVYSKKEDTNVLSCFYVGKKDEVFEQEICMN